MTKNQESKLQPEPCGEKGLSKGCVGKQSPQIHSHKGQKGKAKHKSPLTMYEPHSHDQPDSQLPESHPQPRWGSAAAAEPQTQKQSSARAPNQPGSCREQALRAG